MGEEEECGASRQERQSVERDEEPGQSEMQRDTQNSRDLCRRRTGGEKFYSDEFEWKSGVRVLRFQSWLGSGVRESPGIHGWSPVQWQHREVDAILRDMFDGSDLPCLDEDAGKSGRHRVVDEEAETSGER